MGIFATFSVEPVGIRITSAGLVAYFPLENWVESRSVDGDTSVLTCDYGVVKNVHSSSSTTVEMEFSFKIHKTAAPLNGTSLWARINDSNFPLPSFNIGVNVSFCTQIDNSSLMFPF